MFDTVTFTDRLAEQMTSYGYDAKILAEKIGVSRQAVSKWETGDALPEITKLPFNKHFSAFDFGKRFCYSPHPVF